MSLTDSNKKFILKNFQTMSNRELAEHAGVTTNVISAFLSKEGKRRTYTFTKISPDEEFVDLECLNQRYKISNYGRVLNCYNNKIMKDFDSGGYRRITLSPTVGKKREIFCTPSSCVSFYPSNI